MEKHALPPSKAVSLSNLCEQQISLFALTCDIPHTIAIFDMVYYLEKASELYNAFNFGFEDEWRERQAQWVKEDVAIRGGRLTHDQRDLLRSKLVDRPSVIQMRKQPGYQRSVSEHRVTIQPDGSLESTDLLGIDRLVPAPYYGFGKQRQPKEHKITKKSARADAKGNKSVTWLSEEEFVASDGRLHHLERYHWEEDRFMKPFGHKRNKKSEKGETLVFKSSFARDPYSFTPFIPRVGKDLQIKRSRRGRELLRDLRPAEDRRP